MTEIITFLDDDFEILDTTDNWKLLTIKIVNTSNNIIWKDQIYQSKQCPAKRIYQFGTHNSSIKLPFNQEQNQAQLIVENENVYINNVNSQVLLYAQRYGEIQIEKLKKIHHYDVKYDSVKKELEFSGLNEVYKFLLTESSQFIEIGNKCFGRTEMTLCGKMTFTSFNSNVVYKVDKGEKVQLKNLQKLRIGCSEISIIIE